MRQPGRRRGTRSRHEALIELLRQGTARVDDLAEALAVSASTVRRDLAHLEGERRVARTYGGALVPEAFQERPVEESAGLRVQAKAAIASTARPLIPPASTIFLDAGTTCGALAALLATDEPPGGNLTVVTRGLETAGTLAAADHLDVLILGGQVRQLSHGMVGPLADLALDRLAFAVAFLGADAFDPRRGVGEPTLEETRIKERVADSAARVVVLADSSKLAISSAPAWTTSASGWTLVTDPGAPGDLVRRCAEAGVELLTAG